MHAPAGAVHKGAFPNPIHNTKIRPMFVTIGRINCFMKPAANAALFFIDTDIKLSPTAPWR